MPAVTVVVITALFAATPAPVTAKRGGDGKAARGNTGAAVVPVTPAEAFERGRIAFGRGEWQRAITTLRPLLYPEVQLENDEQVVQAHRMLGVAHLFEGQRDEARQELTKLLELRPDYRFDALLEPAQVVEFFNAVLRERETQIAELELRRRDAEAAERRRAELERGPPVLVEKRFARNSYLINFVPFGAGQFQNGQRRKGMLFLASESVLAAVSVGAFATNFGLYGIRPRLKCKSEVAPGDCTSNDYDRSPQDVSTALFRVQLISGGLFFAVVTWGIVDAVMNYRPEVPLAAGEPPPRPRRARPQLRLAPVLVGEIDPTLGTGLLLRF